MPARLQRMQLGPSQGLRSYFQSRCIGQISQCSCAVMIRDGPAIGPQPEDAGPADQRDVVEVDDVGVGRVETVSQSAGDLKGAGRSPGWPAARGCRSRSPADGGASPGGGVYSRRGWLPRTALKASTQ